MKIVKIKWWDARALSSHPWEPQSIVKEFNNKDMEVTTVGFLVSEDDDKVIVCFSTIKGLLGDAFAIPRGCIKKIEEI